MLRITSFYLLHFHRDGNLHQICLQVLHQRKEINVLGYVEAMPQCFWKQIKEGTTVSKPEAQTILQTYRFYKFDIVLTTTF